MKPSPTFALQNPYNPRSYPFRPLSFRYYPVDWWIVERNSGRLGMMISQSGRRCWCQFGADGPFQAWNISALRSATQIEVEEMLGKIPGRKKS